MIPVCRAVVRQLPVPAIVSLHAATPIPATPGRVCPADRVDRRQWEGRRDRWRLAVAGLIYRQWRERAVRRGLDRSRRPSRKKLDLKADLHRSHKRIQNNPGSGSCGIRAVGHGGSPTTTFGNGRGHGVEIRHGRDRPAGTAWYREGLGDRHAGLHRPGDHHRPRCRFISVCEQHTPLRIEGRDAARHRRPVQGQGSPAHRGLRQGEDIVRRCRREGQDDLSEAACFIPLRLTPTGTQAPTAATIGTAGRSTRTRRP